MQGAVDNYALAFREAETVFKGTDLRYLNTAKEADDLYRRLRQFPPAIACYQGALARLSAPKGGESFYKSMFLTRLGRAYLFAGQLNPAEETFKTGLQYTREKLSERPVRSRVPLRPGAGPQRPKTI